MMLLTVAQVEPHQAIDLIKQGGVVLITIVVMCAIGIVGWIKIIKPASDSAKETAASNAVAMQSFAKGMEAHERASAKFSELETRHEEHLDRQEKLIEKQENLTGKLIAKTGHTGENR